MRIHWSKLTRTRRERRARRRRRRQVCVRRSRTKEPTCARTNPLATAPASKRDYPTPRDRMQSPGRLHEEPLAKPAQEGFPAMLTKRNSQCHHLAGLLKVDDHGSDPSREDGAAECDTAADPLAPPHAAAGSSLQSGDRDSRRDAPLATVRPMHRVLLVASNELDDVGILKHSRSVENLSDLLEVDMVSEGAAVVRKVNHGGC